MVLTLYALGHGAIELNPLISKNMDNLVIFKVIGISLIIFVSMLCDKLYNSKNPILIPIYIMGLVVIWNIGQILVIS